jgi:hypothetical protein
LIQGINDAFGGGAVVGPFSQGAGQQGESEIGAIIGELALSSLK